MIISAKIARVVMEDVNIDEEEIYSQAQAAEVLGITVAGVRSAMDGGRLPTVYLPGKSRRYTLRKSVEEMKKQSS